jgi:hypothetical protein
MMTLQSGWARIGPVSKTMRTMPTAAAAMSMRKVFIASASFAYSMRQNCLPWEAASLGNNRHQNLPPRPLTSYVCWAGARSGPWAGHGCGCTREGTLCHSLRDDTPMIHEVVHEPMCRRSESPFSAALQPPYPTPTPPQCKEDGNDGADRKCTRPCGTAPRDGLGKGELGRLGEEFKRDFKALQDGSCRIGDGKP